MSNQVLSGGLRVSLSLSDFVAISYATKAQKH